MVTLTLMIGTERLAIVRLDSSDPLPKLAELEPFFSLTKTKDEISLVLLEKFLSPNWKAETGWRYIKVKGPLDFGLTGILASIAQPLAEAKISIFAISTFDTDYILLKEDCLLKAISVLKNNGFNFSSP